MKFVSIELRDMAVARTQPFSDSTVILI